MMAPGDPGAFEGTEMTLQYHVLIMDAASGDTDAASNLLSGITSLDRAVKSEALDEVRLCHDTSFWSKAVEFDASGEWAGRQVPGFLVNDERSREARRLFEEMFEGAEADPVRGAQEKALLECACARRPSVRAMALRLLGTRYESDHDTLSALSNGLADPVLEVRDAASGALRDMTDDSPVRDLADRLKDRDYRTRIQARAELTWIGESALPALEAILLDGGEHERWEAAKTISQIGSGRAARALAAHLLDENPGAREVAADGLALMSEKAVAPVLDLLISHPDSILARVGASHVLSHLARHRPMADGLKPVLVALNENASSARVSTTASRALAAMS